MPQVTVYIREKDLERWKQIERKSQFLAEALRSVDLTAYNRAASERHEIEKLIKPYFKKNKSVPQAEIPSKPAVGLCPHGYAKGFCKKADCNRRYGK